MLGPSPGLALQLPQLCLAERRPESLLPESLSETGCEAAKRIHALSDNFFFSRLEFLDLLGIQLLPLLQRLQHLP